jgi:hypothetical protein
MAGISKMARKLQTQEILSQYVRTARTIFADWVPDDVPGLVNRHISGRNNLESHTGIVEGSVKNDAT